MDASQEGEVTRLLHAVKDGSAGAESALASVVFEELRHIARGRMRSERKGHTLQPTALVNEAYLHLVGQKDRTWQNRSHFYAVAAQIMRRILIDHARAIHAQKRGGNQAPAASLDFDFPFEIPNTEEVLTVDAALTHLEKLDPRQCRVVELRYFTGLTEEEISETLGVSVRTVKRDWKMARAFLRCEIGEAAVACA